MNDQSSPDEPNQKRLDSTSTKGKQANSLKISFFRFAINAWAYIKEVLSLHHGADINNTIEGIKRDIDFKGHNVWILIASIFIASIGLNTNSAAAIIGAMLISPLMGPILGAGLAIGTNDFKMLKRSLRSFSTAVVVSIITSTIYFLVSPISEAQSELLARTKPTILDVLIAVFGGLAGIIAGSRKEKSNVIPGVAIATALMPPLCTAGFGLATAQWSYFFGAFYLFILNSIFICLSTYSIVRYLDFPKKSFLDPTKERNVKRYIVATVLVIVVPSAFLFWDVIKESIFRTRATNFINENLDFRKTDVMNTRITYGDTSRIDLYLVGEKLEDDVIQNLRSRLLNYGIENTILKIHQSGTSEKDYMNLSNEVRVGVIEELYQRNEDMLLSKDSVIQVLEGELKQLKGKILPLAELKKELSVLYPEVDRLAYAQLVTINQREELDTVPTFMIAVDSTLEFDELRAEQTKIREWLKVRLNADTVNVIGF